MSREKGSKKVGAAEEWRGGSTEKTTSESVDKSKDCDDITFTAVGNSLCISYDGSGGDGEEYEVTVKGKGCRSIMVCKLVDGKWECSKKKKDK